MEKSSADYERAALKVLDDVSESELLSHTAKLLGMAQVYATLAHAAAVTEQLAYDQYKAGYRTT